MAASTTLTPEQRRERSRKAGQAAHSDEHYVTKVIERLPRLDNVQRTRLAMALGNVELVLRPAQNGGR